MGKQLNMLDWLEAVAVPCPAPTDNACEPVLMHRIDRAKNMQRYYLLRIERDLFQQFAVVREWGRIGRSGQWRSASYPSTAEAQQAIAKQIQAKVRRGYKVRADNP